MAMSVSHNQRVFHQIFRPVWSIKCKCCSRVLAASDSRPWLNSPWLQCSTGRHAERPKRPPFETASPWRHRVCPFINWLLKHVETLRFRLVNWGEHAEHPESLRKAVLRKAAPVGTWNALFWNLRNLHWCPGTLCCFPLHISSWTSFCGSKCARWKGKTSMKGHLPFFSSIAHQITCATHVLLGIGCCSEPLLGSTSSMSFR